MALSVLNNIASLAAQNQLGITNSSLQKALFQLSSGSRINTGADDAAGLAIADGLHANITALTQSARNANDGVGELQVADGSLAQVTTLLNRAVTLATEASTTGITTSQATALNTEFTSIKAEIDQIGSSTNFNGANVFTGNTSASFTSTQSNLLSTTLLQSGSVTTITDMTTGSTFNFKGTGSNTVGDLVTAVNAAVTNKLLSSTVSASAMSATVASALTIGGTGANLEITTNDTSLGALNATTAANNTSTVFISDGQTATVANNEVTTSISTLSAHDLTLDTKDLSTSADAQSALTTITAAISSVSAQRGQIGASVNRLTAASANMSNEVTNLQSAANSIQNADIGKTVANMTQYNVLQSTGMAALQQSNQAQQAVLKLVQ